MKRTVGIAAIALGLGSAALSLAQVRSSIDPTPSGVSFRGGVVLPIDDTLRDVAHTWTGFGMDYTFPVQYFKGSETFLSVDYNVKGSSGDRGTFWPVMVNQKFFSGGNELGEDRSYLFVGVGAIFFDITGSDTQLGARIGFGREFGQHIFGEAAVLTSRQSSDGLNANSFGFWVGYRF